jgi:predicted nucleotidyltransferase
MGVIAFVAGLWKNTFVPKTKKTISIKEIRNRLTPIFKDPELRLVLLFGSTVSEKMHEQSDIDLAFLYNNRPEDIVALTNTVIRLLHSDSVDVVDLKSANPLLKFSIAKNCQILYEKKQGMFNEFYSLAFRMYVDTKKLRSAQETAIRRFLEAKGLP